MKILIRIFEDVLANQIKTHYDGMMKLKQLGFRVNPHIKLVKNVKEAIEYCKDWETKRFDLDYATDGVVIKVNNNSKRFMNIINKFINVKELNIELEEYVEDTDLVHNINNYVFTRSLEKITFSNVRNFGIKTIRRKNKPTECEYYNLDAPLLKCVEFNIQLYRVYIEDSYFKNCSNLKEITYVLSESFDNIQSVSFEKTNLRKVNIKYLDKEYNLNLNYVPASLRLSSSNYMKNINVSCSGNGISSRFHIDTFIDDVNAFYDLETLSNNLIENYTLIIPEYITDVKYNGIYYTIPIKHIKFNSDLLKTVEGKAYITDSKYYHILESISIINNDIMSLFPEKVIDLKRDDYGKLLSIYIEDKMLVIEYELKKLLTDGKVIKYITPKKEEPKEIDLNKYSVNELEEYLYYRKLLELTKKNNDKELDDAMNVVGDKIIKRLKK